MARGRSARSADAIGITTAATEASIRPNTISVRPPSRPIDRTSEADATPVMSRETTSGMTVMRIAFTHIVPMGVRRSAAWTSDALPDAPMMAPTATAEPSAMRTRVLSFMAGGLAIRKHEGAASCRPLVIPHSSGVRSRSSCTSRALMCSPIRPYRWR